MSKLKTPLTAPDCSEPDDSLYPPNINAMLRDIKIYRRQILDPEGYAEYLRQLTGGNRSTKNTQIKGAGPTGRKD